MKSFVSAFISVLTLGVSAFAMPSMDGTYTCANAKFGSPGQVTLTTRNNKLYIDGVGTDSTTGLSCENSAASKCTDKELESTIILKEDDSKTNLTTDIRVTKVSDTNVTIALAFSGISDGSPVNVKMTLDCKK